jgi:chromosome segregation ATPase
MVRRPQETELDALRSIAEERSRFLEITSTALRRLSGEADRRKAVAEDLQRVADERQAVIDGLQVELERALAAADEVAALRAAMVAKEEALRVTQQAAAERLAVIERLSDELRHHQAESDRALNDAVGAMNERLAMVQQAADERLRALDGSAAEVELLREQLSAAEAELVEREQVINDLKQVADDRLAGMKEIEVALHQMREEAEKRALVLADMSDVLERQDREIERLRARR